VTPRFRTEAIGRRRLEVREDLADAVISAGLADPGAWESRLAAGSGPAGRGRMARLELPGSIALLLKRMRRGGLAAALWRDRFAGTRRLLANLRLPSEAARRGIPSPQAAALLLEPGPPGLWRA
jgi:hypothetical protein